MIVRTIDLGLVFFYGEKLTMCSPTWPATQDCMEDLLSQEETIPGLSSSELPLLLLQQQQPLRQQEEPLRPQQLYCHQILFGKQLRIMM